MKLHYAQDCSCRPQDVFPTGGRPQYLKTLPEASQAFLGHVAQNIADDQHRYWAVHHQGKHVIAVED